MVVLKKRWSFIKGTIQSKVELSDNLEVVLNMKWSLVLGMWNWNLQCFGIEIKDHEQLEITSRESGVMPGVGVVSYSWLYNEIPH